MLAGGCCAPLVLLAAAAGDGAAPVGFPCLVSACPPALLPLRSTTGGGGSAGGGPAGAAVCCGATCGAAPSHLAVASTCTVVSAMPPCLPADTGARPVGLRVSTPSADCWRGAAGRLALRAPWPTVRLSSPLSSLSTLTLSLLSESSAPAPPLLEGSSCGGIRSAREARSIAA